MFPENKPALTLQKYDEMSSQANQIGETKPVSASHGDCLDNGPSWVVDWVVVSTKDWPDETVKLELEESDQSVDEVLLLDAPQEKPWSVTGKGPRTFRPVVTLEDTWGLAQDQEIPTVEMPAANGQKFTLRIEQKPWIAFQVFFSGIQKPQLGAQVSYTPQNLAKAGTTTTEKPAKILLTAKVASRIDSVSHPDAGVWEVVGFTSQ